MPDIIGLAATFSATASLAAVSAATKRSRAEPVAAEYERGRVRHVRGLGALEDELCGLVVGGVYAGPGRSPDRADALVWAVTELLLQGRRGMAAVRSLG